jgi:hypothetical protein
MSYRVPSFMAGNGKFFRPRALKNNLSQTFRGLSVLTVTQPSR